MIRRAIPARPQRRREQGFSLLEAIVALALVATTGLALMAWINASLNEVNRLQQREAQARLLLAATQAVQTIDPMKKPQGQMALGSITLRWQAEPDAPAMRSAGFEGAGVGNFEMQLFSVRTQASDASSGAEISFDATLVGYRFVGVSRDRL